MRLRMRLSKTKDIRVALLDTGCGTSYINSKLLSANEKLGLPKTSSSMQFEQVDGTLQSEGKMLVQFRFMDLNYGSRITHQFEVIGNTRDEMVIGRDLLSALGIIVNFRDGMVEWNGNTVSVNTGQKMVNPDKQPKKHLPVELKEVDIVEEVKEINDTSVKPKEMIGDAEIDQATYEKVVKLLNEFETLYNGHLGKMKMPDYVLPVTESFKPVHARPYSIPRSEEEAAYKEIHRLIELDVLEEIFDSEMASPAFFLKKIDGRLRLLTDFRVLNQFLKRHPYYVPLIREVLAKLGGARYFSSLDANMGYYARQIAKKIRKYTAFCTTFGKFQYKRLPMGISTAPDEYQACMMKILGGLDFVIVYLDDILIFSKTAEDHVKHLRVVFERLKNYNVTLNGKKCHIFCKTVEYLGFNLSAYGIQPQEKKIVAITRLKAPKTKRQLRRFLGLINYYREMIPNKSALLKPLTKMTSPKATFVWTSIENEAFEAIKKALAEAVLLSFPDFSKPFDIYADASGKQLGGLIQQEGKLIACFSRTLTEAQQNYTTMELELLSVVEILEEYRTMLLGFPVVVHTDHKNLIYPTENSLRVKRWKLLLAEYRLECKYIPGKTNIAADAFSRMECKSRSDESTTDQVEALFIDPGECVLKGDYIKQYQQEDGLVQALIQKCLNGTGDPDYRIENTMGARLLTFQKRVVIPKGLRLEMVEWYHLNLVHPGAKRQFHTMRGVFYWSGMETTIVNYCKNCKTCKRAKLHGGPQAYGKIPPRDMHVVDPFDVVHVDTIGPYGRDRQYALTIIDEATRWLEVAVQPNNQGKTTAENFDMTWLCRYPRPKMVVFDRGNEFNTSEFQEMLASYAVKPKPISAKNPQANAICERVHLVLSNCIRCNPDIDWRNVLQYAAFSARTSYHTILGTTPAQLIFGQDLITRKLYEANWNYLCKRRFEAIIRENDRVNLARLQHFYHVGDQVMVRIAAKDRKSKHRSVANGPFAITEVHDNGTVTIDKGVTQERVNIRRIFPC